VPNDPYDNRFWKLSHSSPAIWDDDRQGFIHNAVPVPVHSHNDYWRSIPLFEALASGCISVEADVHLRESDLLVGHSSVGLNDEDSLRTMYLDPLQRMVQKQNVRRTGDAWRGIFDRAPQQTVVLLVDLKTEGEKTFAELDRQLQSLRDLDFLTYWDGERRVTRPLTIVASGNAPFESVLSLNSTRRDIFWDAKLEILPSQGDVLDADSTPVYTYNASNSYYASTRWTNARLYAWHNESLPQPSSPRARDVELTQIDQAKARGLVSRYWDTPTGPPNLRDIAWRVLVERQVGIIGMDDLGIVRARAAGWGKVDL
jgi:hypothetical protein